MDRITPERRSVVMRSVRQKNTLPEMVVRRLVHSMGARYLVHDKRLPGTPDLVFPRRRLALFVHGCFWHRHQACSLATTPKSNAGFWLEKFQANVLRDRKTVARLEALEWRVVVIWECETRDLDALRARLTDELRSLADDF